MRLQLQKFTAFANSLLPHETSYLLQTQKFKDEERLAILKRIDFNAKNISQFTPFDISINKRKYNHLKNWIQNKLATIDVDEEVNWMLDIEQKIITDNIRPEEEKELLRKIKSYHHPIFFFTKFYELVEHYRHFLLVRIRYHDHQLADDFLKKYKEAFLAAKNINEKIHKVTLEIVSQYSGEQRDSKVWENWLSEIFYSENIEGHLRYLALVRLVFIAHNYRKYDSLREKFDYLDRQFSGGIYYSKRLLVNYYSNRLMLHSNFKEYETAVKYGYLSVRAKNHDYIFYVNNLCSVLLRINRPQEALQLMQGSSVIAKKTKNLHNRIGHVALHMEALCQSGMHQNAIRYGQTFLNAFTKQVLEFRWYLFFSVFLEAMISRGKNELILKVCQKYQLLSKDEGQREKANYLPIIPIIIKIAEHREGKLDYNELCTFFEDINSNFSKQKERLDALKKWVEKRKAWIPEVVKLIR